MVARAHVLALLPFVALSVGQGSDPPRRHRPPPSPPLPPVVECRWWCDGVYYGCEVYGCNDCPFCAAPRSPPSIAPPPPPPAPPLIPAVPGGVRLCATDGTCSSSATEGRVEIVHDNQWGTVCDDGWGIVEARAVCRQLGFSDALYHWGDATFGVGLGPIWMDDVACAPGATRLDQCSMNSGGWGSNNCDHVEDAGVSCDPASTPPLPPRPPPSPPQAPLYDGDLRLRDGPTALEGRLEVYHCTTSNGNRDCFWGTVCDNLFGEEEATVACRQLGMGEPTRWQGGGRYGRGAGIIWLDDLGCVGSEARLGDCPFRQNTWGSNDCSHLEDAGLKCLGTDSPPEPPRPPPSPPLAPVFAGDLRLVDGPTEHAGRVEIFHNGEWGTVCDDGWGPSEARAVCRQLGYADAAAYEDDSDPYGSWSYDYEYMDSYSSYDSYDTPGRPGRLPSPHPPRSPPPPSPRPPPPPPPGGVDGAVQYSKLHYGRGTGPIWLDDVACRNNDGRLDECSHQPWSVNNCGHSEDVGVRCMGRRSPNPPGPPPLPPSSPQSEGQLRLMGGDHPTEGRVEIFHAGVWGTICDDGWGAAEAHTVCRQLGHGGGISVSGRDVDARFFGEGSGPIWLDDVSCPEGEAGHGGVSYISSCAHQDWGTNNCEHNEDAGVICAAGSPPPPPPRPPPSPPTSPYDCSTIWRRKDARAFAGLDCTLLPNPGGDFCSMFYESLPDASSVRICLSDGTNSPSDGFCDASGPLVCSPPSSSPPPPRSASSLEPSPPKPPGVRSSSPPLPPSSVPPPLDTGSALNTSRPKGSGGASGVIIIFVLLLFVGLVVWWFGRKRGWFDTCNGWLAGWLTTFKRSTRSAPVVYTHHGGDSMAAPLSMNVMPTGAYAPPLAPLPSSSEAASFTVTVAVPLQAPAVGGMAFPGGTPLPPLALPAEPLPDSSIMPTDH